MAPPAAFRLLAVSALLLLCNPIAFASQTPSDLIEDIQELADLGHRLQGTANSISIISGPLIVINQGPYPQIISEFGNIVQQLSDSISAAQDTKPFNASEAEKALDAVRDLVREHQTLLNILTGKAGLFPNFTTIQKRVSEALRPYAKSVDAFLSEVASLATAEEKSITAEQRSLASTINFALHAYEPTQVV